VKAGDVNLLINLGGRGDLEDAIELLDGGTIFGCVSCSLTEEMLNCVRERGKS
jgi:hypothetical protein